RKPSLLGFAILATQLALAVPAAAQDPDPVVARVNGADVRASDLALAEEDAGGNLPPMTPEGKRDYLTMFIADMILVANAAEARKIPDVDESKGRLAYFRNKILMEMLLQSEAKNSLSDATLRQAYEEATRAMRGEQEVHARHILVATEEEAKAVLAELRKGGDFTEL